MARLEEIRRDLLKLNQVIDQRKLAALQQAVAKAVSVKVEIPLSPELRRTLAQAARVLQEERERGLPENWQELNAREIGHALDAMEDLGTSLVWVPSTDTLRRLLRSKTKDPHRRLVRFERPILEDIEDCLRQLRVPEVREFWRSLIQAVAVYREGHYEAAQALAASVITAAIHLHFDPPRFSGLRKKADGTDPRKGALRDVRSAATLVRVGRSIETFDPEQDPVPTTFNRHATAHTVSAEQFTRANSLAALMLATSVAREIEQDHRDLPEG